MPVGTLQNALSHPLNPLTCQCHLFTHLQPPSIFLGFGLTGCWKKAVWRRCGQLWIIYIAQPSLLFFFFFVLLLQCLLWLFNIHIPKAFGSCFRGNCELNWGQCPDTVRHHNPVTCSWQLRFACEPVKLRGRTEEGLSVCSNSSCWFPLCRLFTRISLSP